MGLEKRLAVERLEGTNARPICHFYSVVKWNIRELKQHTFLSSRTSDCQGGLDRQRRFWREILMLSKTRSATQTGLFCLYFLTGILER